MKDPNRGAPADEPDPTSGDDAAADAHAAVDVPLERLRASAARVVAIATALAGSPAANDDGGALSPAPAREYPPARPRTRAGCAAMPRPCPFVSCAYHLYLDVDARSGRIRTNFPGRALTDLAETCALDVAEQGGLTLAETGALINLSRERVHQLEARVLAKLRGAARDDELEDAAQGPEGWESSEPGGLEDL